jgi:hypothetical protein
MQDLALKFVTDGKVNSERLGSWEVSMCETPYWSITYMLTSSIRSLLS